MECSEEECFCPFCDEYTDAIETIRELSVTLNDGTGSLLASVSPRISTDLSLATMFEMSLSRIPYSVSIDYLLIPRIHQCIVWMPSSPLLLVFKKGFKFYL